MPRGFLTRLRAFLFRARHEAELDEELRYHFDREVERRVAAGRPRAEALAEVRRLFGRPADHQDAVRAAWGFHRLDTLRQDVRYALRTFRREPTLVATVMLTVGLGVAPLAAGFTLFNAYVLRPAPVLDPWSLYAVSWHNRAGAHRFTWDQYRDLARLPVVSSALGYRALYTRTDGRPVSGQLVTGNYFAMLGVGPALGRVLTEGDADEAGPVAVLNFQYWQAAHGGDSTVIGRVIRIRGVALTVVGVAQAGFDGLEETGPDYWAPITVAPRLESRPTLLSDAGGEVVGAVARLRPGTGEKAGASALENWLRGVTADRPEAERVRSVELEARATPNPLNKETILAVSPILLAFALILLAACANIASLMVARGMARQREVGVRLALGAGRARLVGQLVTESLLLSLPAAAVGLLLARGIVQGSLGVLAGTMPEAFRSQFRVAPLGLDFRVQLFVVLMSVGSALVFGLLPAWQTTRTDIVRATRGEFGTDGRPSRLRRALVVGQIAVAAVLVCLTGILVLGSRRAARVEVGFDTRNLAALRVADRSVARVVALLRARPDVQSVAATAVLPLSGGARSVALQAAPGQAPQAAGAMAVSPEFFATIGVPPRSGRTFGADEAAGDAPVVVVNEALARQLWPGRPAVDQTLTLLDPARAGRGAPATPRTVRVIGVVPDMLTGWIGEKAHRPTVFLPAPIDAPGQRLLVRTADASAKGLRSLEAAIEAVEPGTVDLIHSMDDVLAVSAYPFRVATWIGTALGALALALTLTGVYGVMAFTVARRSRELGVRIALGASARRIVGLVMRETARLAAWGIGIGVALAVPVAVVLGAVIELVPADDPLPWIGGVVAVLVGCAAGALVPSRRAARIDPLEAIRAE